MRRCFCIEEKPDGRRRFVNSFPDRKRAGRLPGSCFVCDYCSAKVRLIRIASVSVPSERSTPVSLMLTHTPSAISP